MQPAKGTTETVGPPQRLARGGVCQAYAEDACHGAVAPGDGAEARARTGTHDVARADRARPELRAVCGEHEALRGSLGARIWQVVRHRDWSRLVDAVERPHAAVLVAAADHLERRCVHETLHAGGLARLQHRERSVDVHAPHSQRRRGADVDDGGRVEDDVHGRHRALERRAIADVAREGLHSRRLRTRVGHQVEAGHTGATVDEEANELPAKVTRAAGHQAARALPVGVSAGWRHRQGHYRVVGISASGERRAGSRTVHTRDMRRVKLPQNGHILKVIHPALQTPIARSLPLLSEALSRVPPARTHASHAPPAPFLIVHTFAPPENPGSAATARILHDQSIAGEGGRHLAQARHPHGCAAIRADIETVRPIV